MTISKICSVGILVTFLLVVRPMAQGFQSGYTQDLKPVVVQVDRRGSFEFRDMRLRFPDMTDPTITGVVVNRTGTDWPGLDVLFVIKGFEYKQVPAPGASIGHLPDGTKTANHYTLVPDESKPVAYEVPLSFPSGLSGGQHDFTVSRIRASVLSMTPVFALTNLEIKIAKAVSREDIVETQTSFVSGERTLFPVRLRGKWGYIDPTGKVVVEPQFTWAGSYSAGLAPIQIDQRWGYVDLAGKVSITMPAEFDRVGRFSGGLAYVHSNQQRATASRPGSTARISADGYGYIDTSGKLVGALRQDFTELIDDLDELRYEDGLAPFMQANKWGYLNGQGVVAVAPVFDRAYPFSEGMGRVEIGSLCGYINKSGKLVIEPTFRKAADFSEGLAAVSVLSAGRETEGFIDKSGNMVIHFEQPTDPFGLQFRPAFDEPRERILGGPNSRWRSKFVQGLALVRAVSRMAGTSYYVFIDRTGKQAISQLFSVASSFSEGLAVAATTQNIGYVDKTGTFVFSVSNAEALQDFSGGLAMIGFGRGSWGYLNRRGDLVWETH